MTSVGAADRGGYVAVLDMIPAPMRRYWTEMRVSVLEIGARPIRPAAYRRPALLHVIERMRGRRERSFLRRSPYLLEQSVTDDLELLIAKMARHQAHRQQFSFAAATRQIRRMVAEAREAYRAAGAPYGDDDHGFCRWLLACPRVTPSA